MNKNFVNFNQRKMKDGESPMLNAKSVSKNDVNKYNNQIEAIVKNGETRNYLNTLAKSMLDEMKDFAAVSVDLFNNINTNITQDCHLFLKNASEHKKKLDSLVTEPSERSRRMEVLKSLKDRLMQGGNIN